MNEAAGPGRSWTEGIGNTVFVDRFDSVSYLRWLMDRRLDEAHLSAAFLHEFTHHWCFNSLVGTASGLIELRYSALSGRIAELRGLCARDFLAQTALSRLLRPLAEGLALFAEFDLDRFSGEVDLGTPIAAADLCFAMESGKIYSQLLLAGVRRSGEQIDRKASIYLNAFEIEEGYLPGYMFVKSLYAQLQLRMPELRSEPFLAYLRCYFWEDPVLASIAIDPEATGPAVADALLERFAHRMHQLVSAKDFPARFADFWTAWAAKGRFRAGWGLFVAPEEQEQAVARLQESGDFLAAALANTQAADTRELDEALLDLLASYAHLRSFTIVARAPVSVGRRGDRLTFRLPGTSNGDPPGEWPFVAPPPEGDHECLVVIPTFGTYFVIVLRDPAGNIYLLNHSLRFDAAVHGAAVASHLGLADRAAETISRLTARFRADGYPAIATPYLEKVVAAIGESGFKLWARFAVGSRHEPGDFQQTEAMLRERGLQPIFESEPLALRSYAALSLLSISASAIHQGLQDNQIRMAGQFYLPDESLEDIAEAVDGLLARDPHGLLTLTDGRRIAFLI